MKHRIRHLALSLPLLLAPMLADCTGNGDTKGPSECGWYWNEGYIRAICEKGSGSFRIRYTIEGLQGAGPWTPVGQASIIYIPGAYDVWIETMTV